MSAASFIIVGATGLVGQQLVPILAASGARLLLIGRDAEKLRAMFPQEETGTYADIATAGQGFGTLLYLATVNNDTDAPYERFKQVNVDLALETRELAARARVARFIYFSSTHALDDGNDAPYARSKREAVDALRATPSIDTRVLYLPAVTGDRTSGRLGALNKLPRPLASGLLSVLKALKPTVGIADIALALTALPAKEANTSTIISTGQSRNAFYGLFKWLMDFISALAILLLLWWVMLTVWVMVRTQSPGPGIFRQTRVGRHGREFTCYKFRTMYISAPNVATHEAPASAVTPLGAFLRRTKLDELPQAFNILANQMSLVGPRPCLPSQTDLIAERQARGVLSIKPGITGLAQVNDIDMSDPKLLAQWDERYLRLRSLLLDMKLIVQTAFGHGRSDRIRHRPR